MSSTPEQDPIRATKEESVIAETARSLRHKDETPSHSEFPLRTVNCTIQFGGLIAVNTLNLSVRKGEIFGLIGPNGAGKTTIFNLLTGVYKPTSGEIYFQERRIDGLKPYEISCRGVS